METKRVVLRRSVKIIDIAIGNCLGRRTKSRRQRHPVAAGVAWLGTLALVMLAGSPACAPRAADFGRLPILLVHGAGLDSAYWGDLSEALLADGYPRGYVRAIDMLPRDGSNPRAAEMYVKPAVDELLAYARHEALRAGRPVPGRVILVSHSMGAVSTRWYAVRMAPERVAAWLAIAAANHGTDALCGFPGLGEREMCPAFADSEEDSWVQVALNGTLASRVDATPYGIGADAAGAPRVAPDAEREISYWTIRIDPDRWITPAASAQISGAGGLDVQLPADMPVVETTPGNFLLEDAVGHDDLPGDRTVVRWVLEIVRAVNQSVSVPAS